MPTKIEWATDSWNPLQDKRKGKSGNGYHCTKVSPGCANCYAEKTNALRGNGHAFDSRLAEFELVEKTLQKPLHWRKPRRVFVQSMGDLFHEDMPFELIDRVFMVMALCPDHTFMLLTKRPEIALAYLIYIAVSVNVPLKELVLPKNVWWGVTAENQEQADRRVPVLLQIPAAVRFVSVEPMLGGINLEFAQCTCPWPEDAIKTRHLLNCPADIRRPGIMKRWSIDWVICGGESGPGARPMHPDWARSLRDQCQLAEIPFFFKQWGEWLEDDFSFVWPSGMTPKRVSVHKITGETFDYAYPYNAVEMMRLGKKQAGRLLDGREWDELPEDERIK